MDASNKLLELIRDIVKDNTNRLDKSVICMVESVNADGTVNIRLPSDVDNIINNIPNNSAYKFEYGDYAVLYKMENKLNNAFIIAKVTKDSPEFNIIQTYNFNGASGGSFRGMTDMQVNGLSVVNNGVGNIITTTTYNESNNKITTEDFVNSSIATNTAYFIGTFPDVSSLNNYSGILTNNDYAFVVNSVIMNGGNDYFPDFDTLNAYNKNLLTNFDYAWVENGTEFDLYRFDIVNQTWGLPVATAIAKDDRLLNTAYNRYKYTVSGSTVRWVYEYTLNNSSFTAAQWAAINSGITQGNWVTIGTAQTISGEKTFTEDVKIDGKTIIFTGDCKLKSSNSIYRFGDSSDPSGVMVAANASGVRFLRPGQNNIMDLGTTAVKWKNLYLSNTAYIPIINNGANISVPAVSGTMALTSNIPTSVDGMSGGSLTSPLIISGGDGTAVPKIALDHTRAGQITDDSTGTLFGFLSNNATTLTVGGNSYALNLRGSGARPTYKATEQLAFVSDGTITATASKLAQRDTSGNINGVAFNMCTIDESTSNATMQYNSTNESIEFIFS